jgi:hypothetical protein
LLVIVLSVLLWCTASDYITLLLLVIVLSVLLWCTASDYITFYCWSLYCLSFCNVRLLIAIPFYCWSLYCVSCDVRLLITLPFYCWLLYCLSFCDVRLFIVGYCIVCPSVMYGFLLLVIVLSVLLWCTASHYIIFPFGFCELFLKTTKINKP